ncbi:hypothetical protein MTO96_006316 [Rhipicephalus appendiculatus]
MAHHFDDVDTVAHVTALAGGEARLPCDLSSDDDSVDDDPYTQWTPGVGTCRRRDTRPSPGARAPTSSPSPTPGLSLQGLAVMDSDVYKCRVNFRNDRTSLLVNGE